MSRFDLQQAWAKAIEPTQDPLAPIVLQEAYAKVNRLGSMLTACCSEEEVNEFRDELMSPWTEGGLNQIADKPAFIVALAGLLVSTLIGYGVSLEKDHG